VREVDTDTCGIEKIISLSAGHRITQKSIAHRDVPGEPFEQLCGCPNIEIHPVASYLTEVREEPECLC
jgi:hypothetical protein